jgi:phosphatidylserine decarboxylase
MNIQNSKLPKSCMQIPPVEPHKPGKLLTFLYTNRLGKCIRPFITRRYIGQLYALYQNSSLSKHLIKPFIKKYNIIIDEYEKPAEKYQSFNDFFTRKLKPGRRLINQDPRLITSPADSKVLVFPALSSENIFFIKKLPFNLATFLADTSLAVEYEQGSLMIFRLAPEDYHRFHFPTACLPAGHRIISGRFDSVNPLVYKSGKQPLITNKRHLISLKTPYFDTVLMVAVGALLVGKIIETYTPHKPANKGDETGYFAFGGSTVTLLFKPGKVTMRRDLIQNSLAGIETAVKMGEAVTELQ